MRDIKAYREAADKVYGTFSTEDNHKRFGTVTSVALNPDLYTACKVGNHVAAIAEAFHIANGVYEVGLGVSAGYRKQGTGALTLALIERAIKKAKGNTALAVVYRHNTKVIGLLTKAGYAATGSSSSGEVNYTKKL